MIFNGQNIISAHFFIFINDTKILKYMYKLLIKLRALALLVFSICMEYAGFNYHFKSLLINLILIFVGLYVLYEFFGTLDEIEDMSDKKTTNKKF